MSNPLLEIGQEVFVAQAHAYAISDETCPICFGKLFVVVILGDGSQQPVACDACRGSDGHATGVVPVHAPASSVIRGTVTGIEIDGGVARYRVNGVQFDASDIFTTEAEAESRRAVLFDRATEQARLSFETRFKRPRSIPWTIRYHRDCIKGAERDIAWHRSKLVATEAKSKKKADKEAVSDV